MGQSAWAFYVMQFCHLKAVWWMLMSLPVVENRRYQLLTSRVADVRFERDGTQKYERLNGDLQAMGRQNPSLEFQFEAAFLSQSYFSDCF